MPTPPRLVVVIAEALKGVGLRGVVARGWGSLGADTLRAEVEADPQGCEGLLEFASANILFLDKAPHEWLLPRCCCSVHHGGAGTTAAALRAGVPTIVVPVAYDQWYHGEWVVKLGVGIKATRHQDL